MIDEKNNANDWVKTRMPQAQSLYQKNCVLMAKVNNFERQRNVDEDKIIRQDFAIQDLENNLRNITM